MTTDPSTISAKRHFHSQDGPGRAAIISALLVVLAQAALTSGQTAPPFNLDSERVHLEELVKHHQAIVEECNRLEANRWLEIRTTAEARQERGNNWQEPIVTRLPAICLLVNGPPSVNQNDKPPPSGPLRLDMVNWLIDNDELQNQVKTASKTASNKTKRQTGPESLLPTLAKDRLMTGEDFSSNKLDDESEAEALFRAQLEQMISDDRYQEAIRFDKAKVGSLLSPVILVPGLAGSRLQARIWKETRVNIICKKQHDWQDLWLSLRSFLPIAIDCWIDNVRLELDAATGFTKTPEGVESRVPHFGSVESVRHLDLKSPQLTKYFDSIIERYVKIGYQPDKNLFAAPYDFRLAPQQIQKTFFEPLRQLIDEAASNGLVPTSSMGRLDEANMAVPLKRVTLVCHSMGCTHLLLFLRQQSSSWRRARVRKVIALSSPWAGAMKALKALLVGEQFNLPIVSELKMRELVRSFPSVAYLLPQAEVYSKPTSQQADFGGPVLVQTPKRSYHASQLEELLREVGLDQHWQWFQQSAGPLKPLEPLEDVKVDCLHGANVPTVETVLFRNQTDFPDGEYEAINGEGDGTVNHQSLMVCANWALRLPHLVRHKVLSNVTHTGLLSHERVLQFLTEDAATS